MSTTKRRGRWGILLLLGLTEALGGAAGGSVPADARGASGAAAAEALAAERVAEGMERSGVPGLIVVVVQDGEVVLSKGYGFADLERRIPMAPRTGLRAGSVSKPVAAAAVLQAVEAGELELAAPVDRYLPGLLPPDRFGPASTAAQLLTMTGGYTDDVLEVHSPKLDRYLPLGEFLASRLAPREIRPGIMSYSSWGLALLGRALEVQTGEPFDAVVERSLFAPLGMTASTFRQPLPPALTTTLAQGYSFEGGHFRAVPYDLVSLSPGIALVTDGEDMGRFMTALMPTRESSVLGAAVRRGLLERQAGAHPELRGRSYGFAETWFGPPGTLYHDGNGIGFCSRMIVVPGARTGVFVAANHRALDRSLNETPAFRFVRTLAVDLLATVAAGGPAPRPLLPPLAADRSSLQRFAGQYQSASPPRHNLLEIGMLLDLAEVRVTGDDALQIGRGRYRQIAPGLFQNQEHPQTLALFQTDAAGTPRYLTFGGTGTYERVPWHGRLGFHALLAAAVVGLSLLGLLGPLLRRPTSWLLLAGAAANLAFLAGFGSYLAFGDLLVLFKEVPLSLQLLLPLPWLGAAGVAGYLAARWRDRRRPSTWPGGRLTAASAVASSVLLLQLLYWHVVPW